ncbi:hypothetical protein [Mesoterricola silvestris]|uniref:Uncharacterized protein n=1 Tax=Mesoterricola silvestris TaxID=2927979 RepID=A0AA48KA51_9BACT|nr:hypothetical protein [Mesoterricola silvestris]BDU72967.1 hypothetical protein METEAL_21410 [Mesoterricola silvestris]
MPVFPLRILLALALCAGHLMAMDPPPCGSSASSPALDPAGGARRALDRYRTPLYAQLADSPHCREAIRALAEPLQSLEAAWKRMAANYDLQIKYLERLAILPEGDPARARLVSLLEQTEAALATQTRMECTVHIGLVQSESLALAQRALAAVTSRPGSGRDAAAPMAKIAAEARLFSLGLGDGWDRCVATAPWTLWRRALGPFTPDPLGELLKGWEPLPGVGLPCFLARGPGPYRLEKAAAREWAAEALARGLRPTACSPAVAPRASEARNTRAWHEANLERKRRRQETKRQAAREAAEREAEGRRTREAQAALEARRDQDHAEAQRQRTREAREARLARLEAQLEERRRVRAGAREEEEAALMAAADLPPLEPAPVSGAPAPPPRPPTRDELEDERSSPAYVARFCELACTDPEAFAAWQRELLLRATAPLRAR